jgi:hypothetical protein
MWGVQNIWPITDTCAKQLIVTETKLTTNTSEMKVISVRYRNYYIDTTLIARHSICTPALLEIVQYTKVKLSRNRPWRPVGL